MLQLNPVLIGEDTLDASRWDMLKVLNCVILDEEIFEVVDKYGDSPEPHPKNNKKEAFQFVFIGDKNITTCPAY